MIDGFLCDTCETIIEFEKLGVLGSASESCSPFSEMLTLCTECRDKRLSFLANGMCIRKDRLTDYEWIKDNVLSKEGDKTAMTFYLNGFPLPFFAEFSILVKAKLERP